MKTLKHPAPAVKPEPGLIVPCPACDGPLDHVDGPFGEDWTCPRCAGKPARAAFRPLKVLPEISWHTACDGRVSVFVRKGKKTDTYHVFPLHTDFGGAAFRWHHLDGSGDVYDLLLHGTGSSCSCAGFCYTGSCKHLYATAELVAAGALGAAPSA